MNQQIKTIKLAFVAHEFGLFRGHGGIAAYLYNTVAYLLNHDPYLSIYILCNAWDKGCPLLENANLQIIYVQTGVDVLNVLKNIEPDYVEAADYLGLCLECLIAKHQQKYLMNTIFSVFHHTASRECFEWNTKMPIKYAPLFCKESFMREKAQMYLADLQFAPSNFMAKYVQRNYQIYSRIYPFHHYVPLKSQTVRAQVSSAYDLSMYQDSFNIICISRIEGRKNQEGLLEAFIELQKRHPQQKMNLFLIGNSNYSEITGEEVRYSLFLKIPQFARQNVHFIDFQSQEEQNKFIALADVAVLASYYESFSIAVVNMVYKGVPVLLSKNVGAADCFKKHPLLKEMSLFNPFNKEDLVKKLQTFLGLSKDKQQEILKNQQDVLQEQNSPLANIQKKIDLFKSFGLKPGNMKRKWEIISPSRLAPVSTEPVNIILLSDEKQAKWVYSFCLQFSWNDELTNKLIVLNDSYEFLGDLQDIVNRGLPIILPNFKLHKYQTEMSWQSILSDLLKHPRIIVSLLDNFSIKSHNRKYSDFVFMQSQKINLESLYE